MIALLLAATLCTADTVTFTPTPTIRWTIADESNVDGYNLYYRQYGDTVWTIGNQYPCWLDDGGAKWCFGTYLDVPVQRLTLSEGILYEFAVKAYNVNGESADFSNIATICPPHVWVRPEPWN